MHGTGSRVVCTRVASPRGREYEDAALERMKTFQLSGGAKNLPGDALVLCPTFSDMATLFYLFRVFCPVLDFAERIVWDTTTDTVTVRTWDFFGHQSEEALPVKQKESAQPGQAWIVDLFWVSLNRMGKRASSSNLHLKGHKHTHKHTQTLTIPLHCLPGTAWCMGASCYALRLFAELSRQYRVFQENSDFHS